MSLYEFGPLQLDAERLLLLDRGVPIPIGPKVVETLLALIEHPGEVLTKSTLLTRIWPEGYVDEANLAQNIYVLRKCLRERWNVEAIETIPRRGYRFIAPVQRRDEVAHAEPVRVVMSRNHLRAWKSKFVVDGRPMWCIAATHDIGFERDERNNGLTHKIDPAIDGEREYVNDTLSETGLVAQRTHVTPPDPLTTARTATGGSFHSDGRILVLVLTNTPVDTAKN